MTMRQVMVEFDVEDEREAVEEIKLDTQVKALIVLATVLGVPPARLKEIGPDAVAEVARRQLGKPFSAARIRPVLDQPEFSQ